MRYGDYACNMEINDNGEVNCHGLLDYSRAANGDIRKLTTKEDCIRQMLLLYWMLPKGEWLPSSAGNPINDYMHRPLTSRLIKDLMHKIQTDLDKMFPDITTKAVSAYIGADRRTLHMTIILGDDNIEIATTLQEMMATQSQLEDTLGTLYEEVEIT
jgi:hypothetical protein